MQMKEYIYDIIEAPRLDALISTYILVEIQTQIEIVNDNIVTRTCEWCFHVLNTQLFHIVLLFIPVIRGLLLNFLVSL